MRVSVRQLAITLIPAIAMLMAITMVSVLYQVEIGDMTRDWAAIAKVHPLTSVLSNIGILLWCVTASICAFAAAQLHDAGPNDRFSFLFYAALLSGYLMLDDFFMIHEKLGRWYLGIGPSTITLVLGIAILTHLRRFRAVVSQTKFGILIPALGFLGLSVLFDRFPKEWQLSFGDWWFLIEDGSKWLGIACWCSYYVETSHRLLAEARVQGSPRLE